ncbi:MAG: hypothetical protein HOQ07_07105 [Sinomonas sp.]|nr:hypothetical protein [Sinomonas sp.]
MDSRSIAMLYPHFIGLALRLGLPDFDAAALKDARPRQLTQAVASWLYETTDTNGVTFASRLGDDLQLWALFEQPGDPHMSPKLRHIRFEEQVPHRGARPHQVHASGGGRFER